MCAHEVEMNTELVVWNVYALSPELTVKVSTTNVASSLLPLSISPLLLRPPFPSSSPPFPRPPPPFSQWSILIKEA